MPKLLPPDEKPFRPVADGLRRSERLGRSARPDYKPIDPSLVRSVLSDGATARDIHTEGGEGAPPATREARREERRTAATAAAAQEMPARPPETNLVALPQRDDSTPPRVEAPSRGFERATVQLRFKATPSEHAEVAQLVTRHSAALRTPVSFSHVMRACLNLLRHADTEIVAALQKAQLKRPPNEEAVALADYERNLANVYLEALRNAPRMRSE